MNAIDSRIASVASRYAHLAPALLRVALGLVFLAHAWGKATVFTFPGTEKYFEANGFPGWTVYPVFAAELAGGLALLAGWNARLAALALLPIMLGALKPHLGNGWLFTANGGGWEYPAFLIVALAVQALVGAGPYALGATSREDDRRREQTVPVA